MMLMMVMVRSNMHGTQVTNDDGDNFDDDNQTMKRKIKQHARHTGVVVDQDGGGGDGSVVDNVDSGDGDHNKNNYKDDQGKEKGRGGPERCDGKMAE